VGAAAGLHGDRGSGGQLRQPFRQRLTRQIPALDDTPFAIDDTDRKQQLCEIDSNRCRLHDRLPPLV
jgi:hypothetical protein